MLNLQGITNIQLQIVIKLNVVNYYCTIASVWSKYTIPINYKHSAFMHNTFFMPFSLNSFLQCQYNLGCFTCLVKHVCTSFRLPQLEPGSNCIFHGAHFRVAWSNKPIKENTDLVLFWPFSYQRQREWLSCYFNYYTLQINYFYCDKLLKICSLTCMLLDLKVYHSTIIWIIKRILVVTWKLRISWM